MREKKNSSNSPSLGVRVMSWSRNCPNCITMCVYRESGMSWVCNTWTLDVIMIFTNMNTIISLIHVHTKIMWYFIWYDILNIATSYHEVTHIKQHLIRMVSLRHPTRIWQGARVQAPTRLLPLVLWELNRIKRKSNPSIYLNISGQELEAFLWGRS